MLVFFHASTSYEDISYLKGQSIEGASVEGSESLRNNSPTFDLQLVVLFVLNLQGTFFAQLECLEHKLEGLSEGVLVLAEVK